jgi:hypothetical protein
LANTYGGTPARIINLAAAASGSGYDGPFGVLGVASFNFASPASTTNQYSEDNIESSDLNYFNMVTVVLGSLEYQLEIPSSNSAITERFWTVRIPMVRQELTGDSSVATCSASNASAAGKIAAAKLYDSPSKFLAGDVLVCMKAAQTDTCADTDFAWIDSSNGSTSTTRPTSPVRLAGTYAMNSLQCTASEGKPDLTLSSLDFNSVLSTGAGIKLSKTFGEGGTTQYSYTSDCTISSKTGTCTGTATTGTKLTATIDFTVTDSMFAYNLDPATDAKADLLKNLQNFTLKPVFINNFRTAAGTGDANGITAKVSLVLE